VRLCEAIFTRSLDRVDLGRCGGYSVRYGQIGTGSIRRRPPSASAGYRDAIGVSRNSHICRAVGQTIVSSAANRGDSPRERADRSNVNT
jgi:hypothetical protein